MHMVVVFWDFKVIPLALVAFMESYSVAHRIASQKNELHFLNASQELFANGTSEYMHVCMYVCTVGSNTGM